jgi:hypothetical protein
MRLTVEEVTVNDVQGGNQTTLKNGVLAVDGHGFSALLLKDDRLAAMPVEFAHPGESVRIIPVKNVLQPRVKIAGPGHVFPGMVGEVVPCREGVTRILTNVCVTTTGRIVPVVSIPYPCGNPNLSPEGEMALRRSLIIRCLQTLETEIDGQLVFTHD